MKNLIINIKTFFTKPRKLNYALVLIIMSLYSGALFYFGTQYNAHAQSDVVVIKQSSPK